MYQYQYWSHRPEGEVWAVQISGGSHVVGACGPLDCEDRPEDMRDFEYSAEDAEWIREHEDEFVLEP